MAVQVVERRRSELCSATPQLKTLSKTRKPPATSQRFGKSRMNRQYRAISNALRKANSPSAASAARQLRPSGGTHESMPEAGGGNVQQQRGSTGADQLSSYSGTFDFAGSRGTIQVTKL